MSEDVSPVQKAAQEMIDNNDDEKLNQEIATEGAYHVVVEGGYHQQLLSDEEADILTTVLVDHGISGLISLADDGREQDNRNIAKIVPLVSPEDDSFQEVLKRLDDGNNYPGLYLDYNSDNKSYTLYE